MSQRTIKRYELDLVGVQSIHMPKDAKLLGIANERGTMGLWVIGKHKTPDTPRKIRIIGTGHPVNEHPGKWLGAVAVGLSVWHIFDCGPANHKKP